MRGVLRVCRAPSAWEAEVAQGVSRPTRPLVLWEGASPLLHAVVGTHPVGASEAEGSSPMLFSDVQALWY